MLRIAAVIVTYNPDVGFAKRLKAIGAQCNKVYVVDNASLDQENLKKTVRRAKANLIGLAINTGIAHAQNVGMEKAFAAGAQAVILFDHDSTPQPGFVQALWRARQAQGNDVIVGCRVYDVNMRTYARHPCYSGLFFKRRLCPEDQVLSRVLMVIASGTLITAEVFQLAGGMREDLFIDYVDWEFCLRARHEHHIDTVVTGDAILEHARGERSGQRFIGIRFFPPGYSEFRYAHIFRNRARLLRAYFFRDRAFVAFEMVAMMRDLLLLLMEHKPWRLIIVALKSWFSGITQNLTR